MGNIWEIYGTYRRNLWEFYGTYGKYGGLWEIPSSNRVNSQFVMDYGPFIDGLPIKKCAFQYLC